MSGELVRPGRECRSCGEDRRAMMLTQAAAPDGHAKECRACHRGYSPWAAPVPAGRVRAGRECKRCGESRLEMMARNRTSQDGHRLICRPCESARVSEWYARGNQELRAAYIREWHARHPEYAAARSAQWRESNREKDREMSRAHQHRRRAAIAGAVCPVSAPPVRTPCEECGAPGVEIDHIVPIRSGGCGNAHDLRWLCVGCNRRKSARLPAPGSGCLQFWLGRVA